MKEKDYKDPKQESIDNIEMMLEKIQELKPDFAVKHKMFGMWVSVWIEFIYEGKSLKLSICSNVNPMIAQGVLEGIHAKMQLDKYLSEGSL